MPEGLVPAGLDVGPTYRPASAALAGEQYAAPAPPKQPLERPLAAVRRYKWLMVGVVIIASVVGVVGTRFITPSYDVRATVWIESKASAGDRGGPIQSAQLLNAGAWIELFKSSRVVDEVVRKLALYLTPTKAEDGPLFTSFALANRFVPGIYELDIDRSRKTWILKSATGAVVDRGTATDSVGAEVGFKWQIPSDAFRGAGERRIPFKVVTPREKASDILKHLVENRLMLGSNFLWLTYRDPNPQLAARTMNTWLSEYVKVAADLKKRNVTEFANILKNQVEYAEKATSDAERAYESFRVNTITLPTDDAPVAAGLETRAPVIASYFDQKVQYSNLKNDRQALETTISDASLGSAPYERLLLIPSVATGPGAQALRDALASQYQLQAQLNTERQSFTDEYPTVKALKKNLEVLRTQTIPSLAIQLLAQLKDREADMQRRIEGASKELQEIPPRTIEEMRLKRAVNVAEGLYTNLKNRYAEAQLAEAGATPDVSVLDTAIAPLSPTSNTAPRIILMAIVGGLGAALALALLLDQVDRRVRYSDQVSNELGLTIAGAVPVVPKKGISSSSPEQVLQFVESFRSLRMHVTHSIPGQKVVLAVTSAAPGDGKSLISANLALSFAEAGLRTVLVDGDTRRGSLHKMFGFSAAGGLTDFLIGSITTSEVVRRTTHENLSFVSCGRRHPRSPELLTSPQLGKFVQHLSQSFDVVIFDTPPLAAGIDGFAISAAAGSVLMVLRLGQTERRLVSTKLSVLDRLPVEVVGAVLNGVPLSGEFQYYAYSAGYSIDGGDLAEQLETSSRK